MIRNTEYYIEHGIYGNVVEFYQLICEIEEEIKQGIYNEDKIRLLNNIEIQKVILMEGKLDILKKVIKPLLINGEYKILVDIISSDFYDYIKRLPNTLMEAFSLGRNDALVITKDDLLEIEKLIFNIPRDIVESMKIKNVMARQISGWSYPIKSEKDVFYYSELSNLYPSIELFNKNIRTVYNDTNGCYQDGESPARCEIRIDYTNLSEENREVADTLIKTGNAFFVDEGDEKHLSIVVDCNREDTILDVNRKMFDLINYFSKQDVLHGTITPEEIYEELVYAANYYCDEATRNEVLNMLGDDGKSLFRLILAYERSGLGFKYIFDSSINKFWIDRDYYIRHLEFLGKELHDNEPKRRFY